MQSFITDLAIAMTISYGSFWRSDETPPFHPSENQWADEHAEHNIYEYNITL